MSVIASFSLPAEEFVLGEILEDNPGTRVRLESIIPSGQGAIPYFWVSIEDAEAVEAQLRESELTRSVEVVDRLDGEVLFRIEWATSVDGLARVIDEAGGAILEGQSHGDGWSFRLRFSEYDDLSAFYRRCVDAGVTLELERVHEAVDAFHEGGNAHRDLTDAQRETLLVALDRGYFEVPREVTLVDLADELGISDSAVSQRIRRGLHRLLVATLETGDVGGPVADAGDGVDAEG